MGRVHELHEISRFRKHFLLIGSSDRPSAHQPISHACIGGISLHSDQHCRDEWSNLVERAN